MLSMSSVTKISSVVISGESTIILYYNRPSIYPKGAHRVVLGISPGDEHDQIFIISLSAHFTLLPNFSCTPKRHHCATSITIKSNPVNRRDLRGLKSRLRIFKLCSKANTTLFMSLRFKFELINHFDLSRSLSIMIMTGVHTVWPWQWHSSFVSLCLEHQSKSIDKVKVPSIMWAYRLAW